MRSTPSPAMTADGTCSVCWNGCPEWPVGRCRSGSAFRPPWGTRRNSSTGCRAACPAGQDTRRPRVGGSTQPRDHGRFRRVAAQRRNGDFFAASGREAAGVRREPAPSRRTRAALRDRAWRPTSRIPRCRHPSGVAPKRPSPTLATPSSSRPPPWSSVSTSAISIESSRLIDPHGRLVPAAARPNRAAPRHQPQLPVPLHRRREPAARDWDAQTVVRRLGRTNRTASPPRHIAAQQLMALCLQEHRITMSAREEWWGELPLFDDTTKPSSITHDYRGLLRTRRTIPPHRTRG